MPKITCIEAQTKLKEITRLKDEFLQTLDHVSHSGASLERAFQLRNKLNSEMNLFARELDRNIYPITVDYDLSLTQMIRQGRYSRHDENIIDTHFPIKGEGAISFDLELISFDRKLPIQEVLTELESRGLVPAKIEHLLAFGAQYPDTQREFFIVAFGSSWDRRVPYLHKENNGERWLGLGRVGSTSGKWQDYYRFLAISA